MDTAAKPLETGTNLLDRVTALPPLPTVAMKILRQFGDEFIDGNKVADIVAQDPATTGRLIGLANSAYFAPRVPVTDMRAVVTRVLGTDSVRTLALGLAAGRLFDVSRCSAFDSEAFWVRALNTATRCRNLAGVVQNLSEEDRDSAYALGLCHELGSLAYAYLEPQVLNTLLTDCPDDVDDNLEKRFGVSRCALTCALSVHWKMPAVFIRVYAEQLGKDYSLMSWILDTASAAEDFDDAVDAKWLAQRAERLALDIDVLNKAVDASTHELRTKATAKILKFRPG